MTGMADGPVASNATNISRASSGHGSLSTGALSASRSRDPRCRYASCSAATLAHLNVRSGSVRSASAVSARRPSSSTRPGATSRRRRLTMAPSGPRRREARLVRWAAPSPVHAIVRAAAATSAIRTSASARSSAAATSSWSSSRRRSARCPVRRWSSTRTVRSVSAAAARPADSDSRRIGTVACSTQSRLCTSRSPPRDSFRSGSNRKATSPNRAWRSATDACRSSRWRRDLPDHCSSAAAASSWATVASPATGRAARRLVAVSRCSEATCRSWGSVPTWWPSFRPASQSGYQTLSATSAMSRPGRCTSTTSTSLPGHCSRRPYPPTATRAVPAGGSAASKTSARNPSIRSDSARQNAGPRSDQSARRSVVSRGVTGPTVAAAFRPPRIPSDPRCRPTRRGWPGPGRRSRSPRPPVGRSRGRSP